MRAGPNRLILLLLTALPLSPGVPGNPQSPQMQQAINSQTLMWYLSGRVILEDGSPAENADIETVCSGIAYVAAHSDKSGGFAFQLGLPGNRTLQDASVSQAEGAFNRTAVILGPPPEPLPEGLQAPTGAVHERSFKNCELRARLPGYRSGVVNLANRKPLDDPNIGTLILHRVAEAVGGVVRAAMLAPPKAARKAFEKGRDALRRNKLEDARKAFEKATLAYPKYAAAWSELGNVRMQDGKPDDARRAFQTAIDSDPDYIGAYVGLAALAAIGNRWPEVAQTTTRAIELGAREYPQTYFLNALANFNVRRMSEAEKSAREVERMDTEHRYPGAYELLAAILAMRGEYVEAVSQMRDYLAIAPDAPDASAARARLAEFEKLASNPRLKQPAKE